MLILVCCSIVVVIVMCGVDGSDELVCWMVRLLVNDVVDSSSLDMNCEDVDVLMVMVLLVSDLLL